LVLSGLLLSTGPAEAQTVRVAGGIHVSVQWRSNAPPPVYGPYRGDGNRGGYRDYAFDNGFRDGYREGFDAARDRRRYEPLREKRYREGDNGYNRRYGPREFYKAYYRDGFRAGYEQGFREGRYRGDRRGQGPWDRRW
jgi:hypothetical protein